MRKITYNHLNFYFFHRDACLIHRFSSNFYKISKYEENNAKKNIFREREFYKDKGIPCPKDVEVEEKLTADNEGEEGEAGEEGQGDGNQDYHR